MLRCLRLALFAWLSVLTGCLEFDAQEITFRYDAELDRIDALVVYRGLYARAGNGSSDQPLEKSLADLDSARINGEFYFWSNWPLKVNPTVDRGPLISLLPHFEAETGGLFTDVKGILCGYQFVRIREATAFLKKVNTLLEVAAGAAVAAGFSRGGQTHKFDADTKDRLREFLRSGEKMLVVERGRIELRIPCALSDHRWLKSLLEGHFLDNMPNEMARKAGTAQLRARGGDVTDTAIPLASVEISGQELKDAIREAASFRFFWDNDFSMSRSDDITTVSIGEKGAEELRVVKASDGLYHEAFAKLVRERGDKIEDGLPDQELERRFAAFRTRDCVLPEALAKKRR